MTENERARYLKLALRLVALVSVLGFYPLTVLWPSGWAWHEGQSDYLQMIIGLYATLGVFLWLAARDPQRHLAMVSFAIWSSVVHGAIMAVQSVMHPHHLGHLLGDVPVLLAVAAVLGWLSPEALALPFPARTRPRS